MNTGLSSRPLTQSPNQPLSAFGAKRALLGEMLAQAKAARRETGKDLRSQLAEMIALRYGPGRLAPDEYFQYCLYDDRRYSWRQKTEFFGRHMENGLIPILKEERWVGLANDKLLSGALFQGLDFPTPRTFALYHPHRSCGALPVLRNPAELAAFLRSGMPYPFVAKPVFGMWGRDVAAVEAYDEQSDMLTLKSRRRIAIEPFIEGFSHRVPGGMLFQDLLRPHEAIKRWCGDRICSVRMVVLVHRQAPRLLSTVWKVATGTSMADNYWEPGNMIAAIDPDTGRVGRPFTGLGRDIRYVDRHPDTGEALEGVTLPDWPDAVALCLSATASIPGIRMQAWDVALTDRGPALLEVNVNGGMRLPQLAARRGLFHGDFRSFLERHGYPRKSFLKRLFPGWSP